MKAYFINMHLLVPRSRPSAKVKVKYKGYISQKMAVSGAFVFHKHILFFLSYLFNFPLFVCLFLPFLLYPFQPLPPQPLVVKQFTDIAINRGLFKEKTETSSNFTVPVFLQCHLLFNASEGLVLPKILTEIYRILTYRKISKCES